MDRPRFCFFLGGRDLEMTEIERLARAAGAIVISNDLAWGARLSDYAAKMEEAHQSGLTCVGVELRDDMHPDWPLRGGLILLDHHGEDATRPSSLRQAFVLLDYPSVAWDRRLTLVEANDVGHVGALRAAGATTEEILLIRAEDRAAQGVTSDDEQAGLQALERAEIRHGWVIVCLPHSRCATVTDPLALDPAYRDWPRNCLVCSPGEVNAFADGASIRELDEAFPGGWSGGELPLRGYWGLMFGGAATCCDDVIRRLPHR